MILDYIRENGPFHFKPNDCGNTGDFLIAVAVRSLLGKASLDIPSLQFGESIQNIHNLIYGGGGIMVPYWGRIGELTEAFSDPNIDHCLILPQSIHDCDQLVDTFDERFVVLCRDYNSYNYCISRNMRAEFHVADDMALHFNAFEFIEETPLPSLTPQDLFFRQRFFNAVHTLPDGRKVVLAMREDLEGTFDHHKGELFQGLSSIDLSAIKSGYCGDRELNEKYLYLFLTYLNDVDIVLTDRLHSGIGAYLLNKEVYLLDNNYGKLSSVYECSLKDKPNIHLLASVVDFPYWKELAQFQDSHNNTQTTQHHVLNLLPPQQETESCIEYNAVLELADGQVFLQHITVSSQSPFHINPNDQGDAWCLYFINKMVEVGGTFHLRGLGYVSPSLISNLTVYTESLAQFDPNHYKNVTIEATHLRKQQEIIPVSHENHHEAISYFSGDLDDCFTLYRHSSPVNNEDLFKISACAIIQGIETSLPSNSKLETPINKTIELANDRGIKQIYTIRTNYEHLHVNRGRSHFLPATQGCMCLLASLYNYSITSSTTSFSTQSPTLFSNPFVQSLLSTEEKKSKVDGQVEKRTDKAKLVSTWDKAMQQLSCCERKETQAHNCGRCTTCRLTVLDFLAVGVPLERLSFIPQQVRELTDFTGVPLENPLVLQHISEVISAAHHNHLGNQHWLRLLEKRLAKAQTKEILFKHFDIEHLTKENTSTRLSWVNYWRCRLLSKLTRGRKQSHYVEKKREWLADYKLLRELEDEDRSLPLVTVIIPVYNVESFLSKCLESVIHQTYKNLEIICVNDGSTDNSLSILQHYRGKDSRLNVISQKNAGLSAARNTALRVATGDYILFLDSDDWLDTNALSILVEKSEKEHIDMLKFSSSLYFTDSRKEEIDPYHDYSSFFPDHFLHNSFTCDDLIDHQNLLWRLPVTAWSCLFKFDYIKKYDLKFPEGLYFEDNPFSHRAFVCGGKIACINLPLHHRTVHKGSITAHRAELFPHMCQIRKLEHGFLSKLDRKTFLEGYLRHYAIRNIWDEFVRGTLSSQRKNLALLEATIEDLLYDQNIEKLWSNATSPTRTLVEHLQRFGQSNGNPAHFVGLKTPFSIGLKDHFRLLKDQDSATKHMCIVYCDEKGNYLGYLNDLNSYESPLKIFCLFSRPISKQDEEVINSIVSRFSYSPDIYCLEYSKERWCDITKQLLDITTGEYTAKCLKFALLEIINYFLHLPDRVFCQRVTELRETTSELINRCSTAPVELDQEVDKVFNLCTNDLSYGKLCCLELQLRLQLLFVSSKKRKKLRKILSLVKYCKSA
jgi:glycosyltransferase involved in cell wall biosynthesis/exopolysaccharide biosynthesis predicted pyruvyltransferase EpsI